VSEWCSVNSFLRATVVNHESNFQHVSGGNEKRHSMAGPARNLPSIPDQAEQGRHPSGCSVCCGTKKVETMQRKRRMQHQNSPPPSSMSMGIYKVPSRVLFGLGIYDLIRGFMHTFVLRWSGTNIAGFNAETTPIDQYFMLGTFGISNFLTGFIYLLISRRSPELSPYALALIPGAYLLGLIGIWSNGIHGTSAYGGRYLLYVYFAVCIGTLIYFAYEKRK
jgi:hypothetical protein